jgi:hypothetical protein
MEVSGHNSPMKPKQAVPGEMSTKKAANPQGLPPNLIQNTHVWLYLDGTPLIKHITMFLIA